MIMSDSAESKKRKMPKYNARVTVSAAVRESVKMLPATQSNRVITVILV